MIGGPDQMCRDARGAAGHTACAAWLLVPCWAAGCRVPGAGGEWSSARFNSPESAPPCDQGKTPTRGRGEREGKQLSRAAADKQAPLQVLARRRPLGRFVSDPRRRCAVVGGFFSCFSRLRAACIVARWSLYCGCLGWSHAWRGPSTDKAGLSVEHEMAGGSKKMKNDFGTKKGSRLACSVALRYQTRG